MTRPEEELLILSCLEPLDEAEQARFKALAAQGSLDWTLVGDLAELNKIEPRLTSTLKAHQRWDLVPTPIAQTLSAAAEAVAAVNRARVKRGEELFRAFQEARVEFCLLKGVLFAETLYGDPLYKRMNDIDMLIHAEDAPRIVELYQRLGYFSIVDGVAKRPELSQKTSHHLPPFVSRELDCMLGTQWGLKSPRAGLKIDYPAIWRRIEPAEYHGIPIHKLSSRDNLFHVCVHLGIFKSGLRDLMDIANLIRQESAQIDWAAFIADVRQAGAQSLVVHALMLVNCIDPRPETKAVLAALRPDAHGFYLAAAEAKTVSPAVLLRSCSGHLSTVEKSVGAFGVAKHFPEKSRLFVQFWRSVLLAPAAECDRLSFVPETGALRSRVAAPAQILRAIGAEVGGGLVTLLLLKSVVDLTVSFARWPFGTPSENNLEAYARSLGLTLADLERIKDAIH